MKVDQNFGGGAASSCDDVGKSVDWIDIRVKIFANKFIIVWISLGHDELISCLQCTFLFGCETFSFQMCYERAVRHDGRVAVLVDS